MKRILALLAVLLSVSVASAEGISTEILATQTVSTAGGAVSADHVAALTNSRDPDLDYQIVHSGQFDSGYLTVKTTAEVATASLIVTVLGVNSNDAYLICTATAITTETTWVVLLGSAVTAAEGVDQVCDFPLPQTVRFTFTVTGAAASFDVRAYLDSVGGAT